jgi:UDP-glucose 6-dehydrogenase
MSEQRPIGVIGVGWVGLVTATCFAELGHPIFALDVVEEKIEALRRGSLPIHEPGIDDLLARNRERLTFTTDMSEVLDAASLLFCCVDTPPTYSGDADLSRVQAVVAGLRADGGHALVMKSTVPAGTGAAIRRDVPDLAYVSCPEFLKEGSAVQDFLHPDRVVIGAEPGSEWAADAVEEIYRPLGGELVRTDVASAEMIKLASNAFLATKISFVNEIANVCEEVGADVEEVSRGMGLDQRIGPSFLRAGIGYGGSCFAGEETLLVRLRAWPRLMTFAELWEAMGGDEAAEDGEAIAAEDLEVWSWVPGEPEAEWMPVSVLTKRDYDGDMIEVRTKMGRRLRVTADHPFIAGDGRDDEILTRVLASDLTESHWLPLAPDVPTGIDAEAWRGGGADQIERALFLVPERDRVGVLAALAQQSKRIASTGYRRFGEGLPWVRVTETRREAYAGPVYSLKVPGSQTVVTSGGLVASQCFPKDVSALKQLAGNTGYHFQLLTAVIEVNELQKRRVIKKLEKHLGSLVGRRIALLGLAFKPNTDDMREASSLVLSARLQGEGATVTGFDPVAEHRAGELLPNVALCDSAEEALDGADAVVLVTEWAEFADLDWEALAGRMATPLVVDGRNFLDADRLRAAGFTYEGIGRPGTNARGGNGRPDGEVPGTTDAALPGGR